MDIQTEEQAQSLIALLRQVLDEIPTRDPWMVFRGRGRSPLSPKFNVLIYRNNKGRFKLVTTDELTLNRIAEGCELVQTRNCRVDIDDAGIGCPVGGVLIGAYKHGDGFLWREIEPKWFQSPLFVEKMYVQRSAELAMELLETFHCPPEDTVVYLCTGYIHHQTKARLRELGYEVQVTEIQTPLQELLEESLKDYLLERFGFAGFYDPKVDNPRVGFHRAMEWIRADPQRLAWAKTGWRLFEPDLLAEEGE